MTTPEMHKTGTHEAWLAARLELLKAEKELTRHSDEVTRMRRELPWVRLEKGYRFDTESGSASLADLFGDTRSCSSTTSCLDLISKRGVRRARQLRTGSTESSLTWETTM